MWISIRAKNLIQVGLASAKILSEAELKAANFENTFLNFVPFKTE